MKPLISIIITSFNQADFLGSAVTSILSQDYENKEIILIDGGSTDQSLAVIKKYEGRLKYWVSEPDGGQAHAINKGFAHAEGDIITFLSSDDFYLPGAFTDVARIYTEDPKFGAVIGGFCFLEEGSSSPGPLIASFIKGTSPTDLTLGPPGKYRLHQVSTFYTRTALDKVGRFVREDMHYVMDRELLYRVCSAFPIHISGKPYGVFRKHAQSKSVSEILPFAREFADLYNSGCSGVASQDRLRKRMARYRLMRGYLKFSQSTTQRHKGFLAWLRAGLIFPQNYLARGYWKKLARFFKISIVNKVPKEVIII